MFWRPRFRDLAREVLSAKRLRARNTYLAAEIRLNRLTEFFGGYRLPHVTEAAWQAYIAFRLAERPTTKFADDRKYLRQVLSLALRRGLVKSLIPLPVPDVPSDVGREVTDAELKRLYRCAGPELRFQIEIAVKMGLRLREMLLLEWDRMDWDRRMIRLRPGDTKTRRGRDVPINLDLLPRFEKRFRRRESPYVFPLRTDPSKPRRNNRNAWSRCKRKARVTLRWHDLRHSCASLMARRGVEEGLACRTLGMGVEVYRRIYRHAHAEDLWAVADAMRDRK